uniref:Si:dkey-261l7.2 n=1 Tax=Labrus bergylta TaxID=56723 RepID=A0A3Q3ENB6_9LABR
MPQLTSAAVLQLVLLLSAVPAQYLISQWSGSSTAQRFHATTRMLRIWKDWRTSYLNGTIWMDWANQQISKVKFCFLLPTASKTARRPRPLYVFLRVGDVVMERNRNMVGVVVSWDSELRAPPEWIERMYSNPEGHKAEKTPHYKVLFKSQDIKRSHKYSIILGLTLRCFQPDIPSMEKYFTHFDGERFVMQPWLREIFPEDEEEDF